MVFYRPGVGIPEIPGVANSRTFDSGTYIYNTPENFTAHHGHGQDDKQMERDPETVNNTFKLKMQTESTTTADSSKRNAKTFAASDVLRMNEVLRSSGGNIDQMMQTIIGKQV